MYPAFISTFIITTISAHEWEYDINITFSDDANQVLAHRDYEEYNISSIFDFRLSSITIDGNPEPIKGEWDFEQQHECNETECDSFQNTFTTTHDNQGTVEWEYNFMKDTNDSDSYVKFSINTQQILYQHSLEICFEMNVYTNNYLHFGVEDEEEFLDVYDDEDEDIFYEEHNETEYHMVSIGEYLVKSDLIAQCGSSEDEYNMSVNVYSKHVNGTYSEDGIITVGTQICYQFEECKGGSITYDPTVTYHTCDVNYTYYSNYSNNNYSYFSNCDYNEMYEDSSRRAIFMHYFVVWMCLYLYLYL